MSLVPPFLLLDRYDVTEEIGHGGHAIVYRAHDRVLDREVAVKLLRDESLSPDTIARFRQEVQVTAQLEHAHILHVYDTGAHEGRPYIVMELASGRTLAERLMREGQLPLADALQIARDVGLALAHAHARGVVHRDVKPENILLGDGGAILADFGIARVTQDILTQKITSTGTTVGTVQYMSPEQLCAEPNIDARTDQYSLACVLYEMLAGVRPHISATFEGLRLLRMKGQHVPVSTHRPSVPDYVDDAIATALAPMAADRFRTMEEMLAAIGVEASGEWQIGRSSDALRSSARRASLGTRSTSQAARNSTLSAVSWLRRRSWVAATAVAALVAVAFAIKAIRDASPPLSSTDSIEVFLAGDTTDTSSMETRLRRSMRLELRQWPAVRLASRVRSGDSSSIGISVLTSTIADSVRVQLEIRDGSRGALAPVSALVGVDSLRDPYRLAASLVREALARTQASAGQSSEDAPGVGTFPGRSLEGIRSYVRAFEALRAGNLDSAQHRFARVTTGQPTSFAYADFWSAQTGAWLVPREPKVWNVAARRVSSSSAMHGLDSLLAAALTQMADGAYPRACETYRTATTLSPGSFVAWYGLGECQRLDSAVAYTRSGARFRSSHWAALEAYRRAIEVTPTPDILTPLFGAVLRTTYAESSRARHGRTDDSAGIEYSAMPSLDADTLAFYPVLRVRFADTQAPATWTQATRRGRAIADALTKSWVDRWPGSSQGWYWRALALELVGELGGGRDGSSAEAALRRAAVDAKTPLALAQVHVASARVALRLGNVAEAIRIARLAVAKPAPRGSETHGMLAPLAAFLGDVDVALDLSLPAAEQRGRYSAILLDSIEAFRVRSAMQVCDGLASSLGRINSRFEASFSRSELAARRGELLLPSLRLAVPCLGPGVLSEFSPTAPIDAAYRALAESRGEEARALIRNLQGGRRGATSGAVTWDHIFAEAWVSVQAGDSTSGRDQLRTALGAIVEMSPFTLQQLEQAAGLRNGILLFQQLAERQGTALLPVDSAWMQRAARLR